MCSVHSLLLLLNCFTRLGQSWMVRRTRTEENGNSPARVNPINLAYNTSAGWPAL